MSPLFYSGETIWVWRNAYTLPFLFKKESQFVWRNPKLNDIIIFENKIDGKRLIKRIVATPSDTITLTPNLLKLPKWEVPLNEKDYQALQYLRYIPEGYYLVLGENYWNSKDSRDFGLIHISQIKGKVIWKKDRNYHEETTI